MFVSAYGPKVVCDTVNKEPSMTEQSYKDDCDINVILKRYNGQLGLGNMSEFQEYYASNFEDVSAAVDLQEAYRQVAAAREAFDAMPSDIRSRFANDPVEMLAFLGDARNRDEAVKLGFFAEQKVEAAQVSS